MCVDIMTSNFGELEAFAVCLVSVPWCSMIACVCTLTCTERTQTNLGRSFLPEGAVSVHKTYTDSTFRLRPLSLFMVIIRVRVANNPLQ